MKGKVELTRGWLAKAMSDLLSARKLTDDDGPYDTACFHAQQCIEKLLKAILAYHEKPIPKTHDLDELQRLSLAVSDIPMLAEIDFSDITSYAVELRYDLEFWPDKELAIETLEIASKVMNIVYEHLPEECKPDSK